MSKQLFTKSIVVVLALAVAGLASANDRDFLREVAAAPNLIFILDTSSSMVASPEVTTAGDPAVATPLEGALVAAAMVPGGGDDPYSRMGIAKRVLRDFLDDVGEANIALAGYAQAQPADLSNGVPQKHWVYEARAQDRFHMVEATYAYRLGYSESHAGIFLDVPADIIKNQLIGYKPYFNPATTPVTDRFGPLNAYDTGWIDYTYSDPGPPETQIDVPPPFDLMPIYFGNCFVDNMQTPLDDTDDVTLCDDSYVFPYYDSGVRSTSYPYQLIPDTWYYGQLDPSDEDYPGCDPNEDTWDDGTGNPVLGACENEWEETSGVNLIQYRRRVRLEIPTTYLGNPNHFFGVDASDAPVGNTQVADGGAEDYDLDGYSDADYDGDETNDWMLYVNSVEERDQRVCAPAAALPTWTPTFTVTPTVTLTPSPTPTITPIVDCAKITVDYLIANSSYNWKAAVTNGLSSEIVIEQLDFTWIPKDSTHYVDHIMFRYYNTSSIYRLYGGNDYTSPTDVTIPWATDSTAEGAADLSAGDTAVPLYINMSYDTRQDGYHELCLDFIVYNLPTAGANWSCPAICAENWGSLNTPTPTPTITPTLVPATATPWPTATSTNTPFGGGSTATPTPTVSGPTNTPRPLSTSTPTPWPTATPAPPTPTNTATRTYTPIS